SVTSATLELQPSEKLTDSPPLTTTTLQFEPNVTIIRASVLVRGNPQLSFQHNVGDDTITRNGGSWVKDGFQAKQRVEVFGSAVNNGTYHVKSVTDSVLTLDSAYVLVSVGLTGNPQLTFADTSPAENDTI